MELGFRHGKAGVSHYIVKGKVRPSQWYKIKGQLSSLTRVQCLGVGLYSCSTCSTCSTFVIVLYMVTSVFMHTCSLDDPSGKSW